MNREAKHVLDLIITPTLALTGMGGGAADRLMVLTGEVETGYDNLRQVLANGHYGEGYGWWSMQNNAFTTNVKWLSKNPMYRQNILTACYLETMPDINAIIWNVRFALCIARVQYWINPEPLPKANDIQGLGQYWLKYYNRGGKGTLQRFQEAADRLGF